MPFAGGRAHPLPPAFIKGETVMKCGCGKFIMAIHIIDELNDLELEVAIKILKKLKKAKAEGRHE